MKLSLLEHRIQPVESENLRLRHDALRAEQLRLSEMQINLERRHSQLSNSYVMDSGGCVNQGDSVLPTRVKSRWTNIENAYTPRPFFPGPASVHMNQCDPNIPTREQSRWTSDRNGYTPRPHFPRPVSIHRGRIDCLELISAHISPNQHQCIAVVPKFHSHRRVVPSWRVCLLLMWWFR